MPAVLLRSTRLVYMCRPCVVCNDRIVHTIIACKADSHTSIKMREWVPLHTQIITGSVGETYSHLGLGYSLTSLEGRKNVEVEPKLQQE